MYGMDNIAEYIAHPERLNRDTLYELRLLVGRYPYFDAARLLMLRNLYLLHDIEFGKELRRAALYLKNRRVLFDLMDGYGNSDVNENTQGDMPIDRTMSLINAFLETLPQNNLSLEAEGAAAVDYVSTYMKEKPAENDIPLLRGQELIDKFLSGDNERIVLQLTPETESETVSSEVPAFDTEQAPAESYFFTETLASIYIKQRKYDKALEIIRRLCLEYPNKNRYFADQIRFLEKIVKYTKA